MECSHNSQGFVSQDLHPVIKSVDGRLHLHCVHNAPCEGAVDFIIFIQLLECLSWSIRVHMN